VHIWKTEKTAKKQGYIFENQKKTAKKTRVHIWKKEKQPKSQGCIFGKQKKNS